MAIINRPPSKEYDENFDKIFRNDNKERVPDRKPEEPQDSTDIPEDSGTGGG